ncbi:hypothetical protein CYMTET_38823 [Cymbomonas tetramitiformis]|uniref:Uncharacterized protein n=1 Tax=Cymbomonas tetramitiformis TaxID=36881 RepID=A0AAE0CD06_9CHLO|nr:hypothetical protein CYMTET_38823 [Cymbomonas tetramitiformis]
MLTAEPQSVKLEPMCGHDSSEGTSAIFPGNLSTGKPLPTELLPDCNPDFPSRRSGSSAFGDTNAAEIHYSTTLNGNLNIFDPDTGATPLTIAIWHAQYGMVQWLISKGVDVEWKDKSGMSPLHVASKEGHQDILELLLEQDLDVNVKNKKHERPLHLAVHFQQLKIVKTLLKIDVIKVNAINVNKRTPLDQCKGTVKGREIRKLLRKYGAMTSDELE